ncbi:hypothetical protein COHA_002754 [Chlorella ohadii]|uniref:Uncharacterized protein n=1 Tax=Chlorella ohadii TaxID=2649997 RepID=A0AAD5DWF0_9CHLO|nr:hypothetical protein COHA_002754 [Chlorella ohadii]
MASNGEKIAGLVWVLSFFLAFSGGCLVLAGLASMQNLCHNDGPIVTNSRRMLQLSPETLIVTCSKAYRFQWWGWALQTAFVLLTAIYWAAKSRNAGVLIIGACATVLGMIFCNDQLKAMDDVSGRAFSRATTTFVGWLVACTGNFLLILTAFHLPETASAAAADKKAPASPGAGTTDVSAVATA